MNSGTFSVDLFLEANTNNDWYTWYQKRSESWIDEKWINPKQSPFNVITKPTRRTINLKDNTDCAAYRINPKGKQILPEVEVSNIYSEEEENNSADVKKFLIIRRDRDGNVEEKQTNEFDEIKRIAKDCYDKGYVSIKEKDLSADVNYEKYLELEIIKEIL